MKGAVYHGPRDLRVEEIDVPEVGPNDVLLKVRACGICGSDVHSYCSGFYIDPGQIMGHEFVGEVVEIGEKVTDIQVGQRGTGISVEFCGTCYWCKTAQYMLCPNLFKAATGYGVPGAFAEYVKLTDVKVGTNFHHVPDEIDDLSAATIEPVGVGVYTVAACDPKSTDKVVILGAGMIGNTVMQVLKAIPVAKVVVSEIFEKRLNAALELGADVVINAGVENVLERVKEEVGIGAYHFGEGAMADIVVEAAGAPATIEQSFEMVRSGGTIAIVGLPEKKASIDTTKIVHKMPHIIGCLGGNFPGAIKLLKEGKVNTKPLITHVLPLKDAKEAFEIQSRADDAIKVMITN